MSTKQEKEVLINKFWPKNPADYGAFLSIVEFLNPVNLSEYRQQLSTIDNFGSASKQPRTQSSTDELPYNFGVALKIIQLSQKPTNVVKFCWYLYDLCVQMDAILFLKHKQTILQVFLQVLTKETVDSEQDMFFYLVKLFYYFMSTSTTTIDNEFTCIWYFMWNNFYLGNDLERYQMDSILDLLRLFNLLVRKNECGQQGPPSINNYTKDLQDFVEQERLQINEKLQTIAHWIYTTDLLEFLDPRLNNFGNKDILALLITLEQVKNPSSEFLIRLKRELATMPVKQQVLKLEDLQYSFQTLLRLFSVWKSENKFILGDREETDSKELLSWIFNDSL